MSVASAVACESPASEATSKQKRLEKQLLSRQALWGPRDRACATPVCLDCHHAVTPDKCLLKADTYKVKRTQRIRLQPTHPWVSGFCRECASRIQDTMHAHREGKWVRAGGPRGGRTLPTAFIFSSLPCGLGRSGPPKAASERAVSRKPNRTGAPQVPWSNVCRATQAMGSHRDPAHTYFVIPQSTGPQTHRARPGLPQGLGGHRWRAWLVSGLQSLGSGEGLCRKLTGTGISPRARKLLIFALTVISYCTCDTQPWGYVQ